MSWEEQRKLAGLVPFERGAFSCTGASPVAQPLPSTVTAERQPMADVMRGLTAKLPRLFEHRTSQEITEAKGPKVGTRVRYKPNPVSAALYSRAPAPGEEGSVTTVSFGAAGKRSYLAGPGGGLVYVKWDKLGTTGIAPGDLEVVKKSVKEDEDGDLDLHIISDYLKQNPGVWLNAEMAAENVKESTEEVITFLDGLVEQGELQKRGSGSEAEYGAAEASEAYQPNEDPRSMTDAQLITLYRDLSPSSLFYPGGGKKAQHKNAAKMRDQAARILKSRKVPLDAKNDEFDGKGYYAMHATENVQTEDLRLSAADKKVIDAFTDKKSGDSKKLTSDGTTLDGNWMGGNKLAYWKGDKIHTGEGRPHVRSDQTVLAYIRKITPKNDMAEASGDMAHWGEIIKDAIQAMWDTAQGGDIKHPGYGRGRGGAAAKMHDAQAAWKKWDVDELVRLQILSKRQGQDLKADLDAQTEWVDDETIDEVSPPGWKGSVKAMKKHPEITNPYALAWSMKNKGAKPHYKMKDEKPVKKEGAEFSYLQRNERMDEFLGFGKKKPAAPSLSQRLQAIRNRPSPTSDRSSHIKKLGQRFAATRGG